MKTTSGKSGKPSNPRTFSSSRKQDRRSRAGVRREIRGQARRGLDLGDRGRPPGRRRARRRAGRRDHHFARDRLRHRGRHHLPGAHPGFRRLGGRDLQHGAQPRSKRRSAPGPAASSPSTSTATPATSRRSPPSPPVTRYRSSRTAPKPTALRTRAGGRARSATSALSPCSRASICRRAKAACASPITKTTPGRWPSSATRGGRTAPRWAPAPIRSSASTTG